MKYQSTRDNQKNKFDSAQAIKQGLANDGGLFVPDEIPALTFDDIKMLCPLSYPERAANILSRYLTDYTYEELLQDCKEAYSEKSFVGGAAPVKNIHDNLYSLELWHGPTAAFKDMALQIMPRLLSRALVKTGEERTALILVATSGDTGKAALEGYKDIDRIKIMVFYPTGGVSRVQKLQMATQEGSNVNVCAIKGNFDDAQSNVKKIFADADMAMELDKNGYFFSSANSINWGRLVPQIVYYISAYCDLVNEGKIVVGDRINFCVPTGNFGNIFAAYLAKLMGLPVSRLICASNMNNVLTDFLHSGTYDRNRKFHLTMSPS
ncbi:MAG: threonine synthase, partial [Clostridia bacterium]|nr:threonine synthase [Clostridia bacterium]